MRITFTFIGVVAMLVFVAYMLAQIFGVLAEVVNQINY
jgi:hypothetical protein